MGAAGYLGLVGGAIGAYGAIEQGQMQSESLNQQAQSNLNNAQQAKDQGLYNANRQMLLAQQTEGKGIANAGASGVDVNSGSPLSVFQSSAINAEMDKQNILHGADIRAIAYENQASIDRFGAASALTGSYWNALSAMSGGLIKSFNYGNGTSTSSQGMIGDEGNMGSAGAEDSGLADAGAVA